MPCRTPTRPAVMLAAWSPVASPFPAASTPIIATSLIAEEGVKETQGVAASADAGDEEVGEPPLFLQDLPPRLAADDTLEIADHDRIGVGARRGADDVEGIPDRRDPGAHRFVHGVLEGRRPCGDGYDLGAEDTHPVDVVRLPADILFAHEDPALHAEEGRRRGCRHAVLAGPGFGDHLFLSHPPGEEHLPQGVVDLVGTRVVHVLPFEIELRPAESLREPPRLVEGCFPAPVFMQVGGKLLFEGRIPSGRPIGRLQFQEGRHQRFRRIASPEDSEMTVSVRLCLFHHGTLSFFKSSTNISSPPTRRGSRVALPVISRSASDEKSLSIIRLRFLPPVKMTLQGII